MKLFKNKRIFKLFCALAMIFSLSFSHLPSSYASSSYFETESVALYGSDSTEDRIVTVGVIATQDFYVRGIDGYFTVPSEDDPEIEYYDIDFEWSCTVTHNLDAGTFNPKLDNWCRTYFHDNGVVETGRLVSAGEKIVEVSYTVKAGVSLMKQTVPITISAIDFNTADGTVPTFEEEIFYPTITVAPDDTVGEVTAAAYITGNGTVEFSPDVIFFDDEMTITAIPDDGYELIYLEVNGTDLTDEVEDDQVVFLASEENTTHAGLSADITVYTTFAPIHEVLEGNGATYIKNSGEPLVFKIDGDLENFEGTGVITLDGDSDDTSNYLFDAEESTITIPAEYLDEMSLGKHKLVAIFQYPDMGMARINFTVVEVEEGIVVPLTPNTGYANTITVEYPYYGFIEDPDDPWESVYDALDETDTIEYSDEYFSEPSLGDHPELRALSYALALAGFENWSDGYPIEGANPKLTDFLEQMGFTNAESWDLESEEDGHSFGTTIAHKTLEDGKTLIVVAPRNYNYMTEWLSNFNVGTDGDHNGFNESADLLVQRLGIHIHDYALENYKIWIAGYSRGGAVVDLAAKKINENLDSYDMAADDFYVYTFGAPKASLTETKYTNIHDVKDGNDLLLGYLFPEQWGFYNTGTYEEIHPADLEIETSAIDISKLADSSEVASLLADNDGTVVEIATENGKDFMDEWLEFINENGFTREYFDSEVKAPLSNIMKAYQLRTLDKQGEFTDFITSTDNGMLAMIAIQALEDLTEGGYGSTLEEALENFPLYQDIVKTIKGTATSADISEALTYVSRYAMEYEDYEDFFGEEPAVSEEEFYIIKDNLLDLVEAIAPLIVADAKYTRETYGENTSLYYGATLVSNTMNLVYGHIPESIMPILKSLIPEDSNEENTPGVPNTGRNTNENNGAASENSIIVVIALASMLGVSIVRVYRRR